MVQNKLITPLSILKFRGTLIEYLVVIICSDLEADIVADTLQILMPTAYFSADGSLQSCALECQFLSKLPAGGLFPVAWIQVLPNFNSDQINSLQ